MVPVPSAEEAGKLATPGKAGERTVAIGSGRPRRWQIGNAVSNEAARSCSRRRRSTISSIGLENMLVKVRCELSCAGVDRWSCSYELGRPMRRDDMTDPKWILNSCDVGCGNDDGGCNVV